MQCSGESSSIIVSSQSGGGDSHPSLIYIERADSA